jgi:hypothetical protein
MGFHLRNCLKIEVALGEETAVYALDARTAVFQVVIAGEGIPVAKH